MRLQVNMKKTLSVLVMIIFLMECFMVVTVVKAETDWTGYTAVSSKADLDDIRNNLSEKYYLTGDIVFTPEDFAEGGEFYNDGAGWKPIGENYSNAFTGTFDGNGFTIEGLVSNGTPSPYNIYAGLFGTNVGVIKNLGLIDSSIKSYFGGPGRSAFKPYSGGVAAENYGTISKCYNTGSVTADSFNLTAYSGGIAGVNHGSINNCYNTGSISGFLSGGIAGQNSGNIYDCYNNGYVSGGGIAADNFNGSIGNCYNTGNASGGVISGSSSGYISNCYYLDSSDKSTWPRISNATSLTVDEMKNQASFSGFDFENVWTMDNNQSYKLPTLKGMTVVNNRAVSVISVSSLPNMTNYLQGQSLNLDGAKISVIYVDGSTENISLTSEMVSWFDSKILGVQDVSVNYGGQATSFKVNVSDIGSIFNSNGGTAVVSVIPVYNDLLTEPTAPTRSGYTFVGWYKEPTFITRWNFATDKVRNNMRLYAKWIANPVVPASLKAVASSFNSIDLSWSSVTAASGYEIYRATSSTGTYNLVGTTSVTRYKNSALIPNTTYYYKVRAYVITGSIRAYGNFTAAVNAKPIPAVPGSFKTASSGYNSVLASWAEVPVASGYELYRSTSSTGTYSLVATTTATSYNNTRLATGTTYYYKVRAYMLFGGAKIYGNFTTVLSAKPIPKVPANFTAVRTGSTSIKLTWSGAAGASGYEVFRSTSITGTYSLIKSTTSLYYTNSSLKTGTTYYYKVRCYRYLGKVKIYSGWTTVKYARQ